LRHTLPIQGNSSPNGSITAADFDADGRDEIAIAHPPDLYVLKLDDQGDWSVRYHRGIDHMPEAGLRSAAMVAADFTGNGHPELVAATADARFHLWRYQSGAAQHPPPQWVAARAQSADAVLLRWGAPQADSVTVFAGAPMSELNPVATTVDSVQTRAVSSVQQYALQAWYRGVASSLSVKRTVRPHDPAVVESVAYPSPRSVALRFTERIASTTGPDQFQLDRGGHPESVLRQTNGYQLVLQFGDVSASRTGVLRWRGVEDTEGMPVAQQAVPVAFPPSVTEPLIVEQWRVDDQRQVVLDFSAPLNPQSAQDPTNYQLSPFGSVAHVVYDPAAPTRVTVEVRGVALGAVGQDVSMRLDGLQSQEGAPLSKEGAVVRLVEPAPDLSNVYAYPNPYHQSRHGSELTIAGLPAEATVRIISAQGALIRVLTEAGRDGGVQWDLHDATGRRVSSGVYLLRVEAPNQDAVLRKVAIVR
jgi:hypothetical protein